LSSKSYLGLLIIILVINPLQSVFSSNTTEQKDVAYKNISPIISTGIRKFISSNKNDTIKIWVFFNDKGFPGNDDYQSCAEKIFISSNKNDTIKIWVFFNDKGFPGNDDYQSCAEKIKMESTKLFSQICQYAGIILAKLLGPEQN